MKWTIKQIREYKDELMNFDVELSVFEQVKSRNDEIIALENVHVTGFLSAQEQDIVLHCQLQTVITLPSSRSLKPVAVELKVPIKERYVYPEHADNIGDYAETTIELEHDYIDLETAIVDAILLNIPLRVIAPDETGKALPSGKDWQVMTEDDYQFHQEEEKSLTVDPRLEALKTLLVNENDDSDK